MRQFGGLTVPEGWGRQEVEAVITRATNAFVQWQKTLNAITGTEVMAQ